MRVVNLFFFGFAFSFCFFPMVCLYSQDLFYGADGGVESVEIEPARCVRTSRNVPKGFLPRGPCRYIERETHVAAQPRYWRVSIS